MALSKSSTAITQLTASGTSTTATTSAGIAINVAMHHSNGSGTVTTAATVQVQYQENGAARWYAPPTLLLTLSTSPAATDDRTISVPDAATAVRLVYTAPVGPTGYTLDAEIGTVTP